MMCCAVTRVDFDFKKTCMTPRQFYDRQVFFAGHRSQVRSTGHCCNKDKTNPTLNLFWFVCFSSSYITLRYHLKYSLITS